MYVSSLGCPQQFVCVGIVDFGESENDTTHGQTGSTLYTAADRRSTNRGKLNGKVARHARHPRDNPCENVAASGVSARMSRECHDDATRNCFRGIPATIDSGTASFSCQT